MNTGLILVDIQNDYFTGGRMELAGMDAAGEKAGECRMPDYEQVSCCLYFARGAGRRFISSISQSKKALLFSFPKPKGQNFTEALNHRAVNLSFKSIIQTAFGKRHSCRSLNNRM